ncbi:MAG TPA: nitroreductase family deazaflavin-dependent oxidoreductase [Candidatus Limnocylindrales bacterium]|nr:nitroreductase family deazaflavin-dependent oxidoreductase [Candidatus Limnocylindrales bacterium]
MDDSIQRALRRGHTIDITTTGRRTGTARRIELVFHNIDGRIVISGSPSRRKRGWIWNLEADPKLTFHLKRSVHADLPATARVITDEAERRELAEWIVANAWPNQDVATMTRHSPFIEVTIDRAATGGVAGSAALDRV